MFHTKKKHAIVLLNAKKVNVTFLAVIKKGINVGLMYLECKLQQDSWFIHFQLKVRKNSNKKTSRDKQTTNKVALMRFDDKRVTER